MSPYISINVCEIVLQTLNCYYISYFDNLPFIQFDPQLYCAPSSE